MTEAKVVRKSARTAGLEPVHPKLDSKLSPLLTVTADVAAALLGTTVATLDRWRSEGRGPTRRSDGSFVRYEVEIWFAKHGHLYPDLSWTSNVPLVLTPDIDPFAMTFEDAA